MVVYQISKALVKRGQEVIVYTSDMRNLSARVKRDVEVVDGIKIVRFKNISSTFSGMSGIVITPRMAEAFDKEIQNFDIIHLHEARSFQHLLVHKYCGKRGVPYIVQAHGILGYGVKSVTERMLRFVYDNLIGLKIFRDAIKVVALTDVEVKQYTSIGVHTDKIEIIPNGIDLSEYANLPPKGAFRKKFSIDENEKIALYLGRIHRTKGIDFLITAFADLIKEVNNARLIIAGRDDGFLSDLKLLSKKLGIEKNVLFLGPVSRYEKITAYVDSNVVVYPCPVEPFGLVTLEAAATGKPVIVSDDTPMARIIKSGKFGLTFKYGDINSLGGSIKLLLTDNHLANEMGERGRKFVKRNFSWDKIVRRIERLYLDSVDKQ